MNIERNGERDRSLYGLYLVVSLFCLGTVLGLAGGCNNKDDCEDCSGGDVGCPPDDDDDEDSNNGGLADCFSEYPAIEFEDVDAFVASNNVLSVAVEVSINRDAEVKIKYGKTENADKETPVESVKANEKNVIYIFGLTPDTNYYLYPSAVTCGGGDPVETDPIVITTGSWPEGWPTPAYSKFGSDRDWTDDEIFCGNYEPLYAYICYNRWAQPVYYFYNEEFPVDQELQALENGNFAFHSRSRLVVINKQGEILFQKSLSEIERSAPIQERNLSIHHDIIQIAEGRWKGKLAILTHTEDLITYKPLPPGTNLDSPFYLGYPFANITEPRVEKVEAPGIIVYDYEADSVRWMWSMHAKFGDNMPLSPAFIKYERFGLGGIVRTVWSGAIELNHTNSIVHYLDDEGKEYFWLSQRHQDYVDKIDAETGRVIWRLGYLGQFQLVDDIDSPDPQPLSNDKWFFHPHAIEIIKHGGGRFDFLIFDNGNTRTLVPGAPSNEYSRGVAYRIDENTMKAMILMDYGPSNPNDPDHFYHFGRGDFDMMPSGKSAYVTAPEYDVFIREVSYPEGEKLWELDFGYAPEQIMYRSDYYPSIYDTTWSFRQD